MIGSMLVLGFDGDRLHAKSAIVRLALALGISLLVAGCASEGESPERRLTVGPLPAPPGSTAWFVVDDGEVFSDGFEVLTVSEKVRIESVSMLGEDGGAPEFLGARLGLPGRPDDFNQRMEGFPPAAVPDRYQVEAEGAELTPGETYMLILGFRVTQDDHHYVREGFRIDYSAGEVDYTTAFDSRIVLCPRPMTEDRCSELFPAQS